MRTQSQFLFALITSLFTLPTLANYSACIDTPNPPECIARRAASSITLSRGDKLETILRHGLVDLVPKKSGALVLGLYDRIGQPGAKMDSPEEQLLDSSYAAALRKAPRKSLIAAMALVAAARHAADPFADPVYLKLAAKAKHDPHIPTYALGLWLEVIGMSGSPPDFSTTPAGLESLWEHAAARKEEESAVLLSIAGTLAYLGRLKPQAEKYMLWFAKRPGLTPTQRVQAASQLAHHFDNSQDAAALLDGLGESVEGYDLPGVRAEVAVARLGHGYDPAAVRLVTLAILDDFSRNGARFDFFRNHKREALEHTGAHDELRELAAECLRRAAAEEGTSNAAEWFASASDLFLRAGDTERAREVARLGMPFVPQAVRQAAAVYDNVDKTNPRAMAIASQGHGTSPVIALYRAGAIEEALKTGYLTGKDRYFHAQRAGEPRDPQWTIDDNWPLYIEVMALDAERSTDRAFQQRAYDGLVRLCGKPISDCFDETLRTIAQVAAGMGDEARMKEALSAAARQLDADPWSVSSFSAMYVAGPWAHCEEVLHAAKR